MKEFSRAGGVGRRYDRRRASRRGAGRNRVRRAGFAFRDRHMSPRIPIDHERIAEFCRKWKIVEFSLFGSILREDFGPESDVDALVEFAPGEGVNFDNRVEMRDELAAFFGRELDIIEKGAIRNPFRRHSIISTKEVLYVA